MKNNRNSGESVYIPKPNRLPGIPQNRNPLKDRQKLPQEGGVEEGKLYRINASYRARDEPGDSPGVRGSSITKPTPPKTVTLKFNREPTRNRENLKSIEKRTNNSESRKKLLKPTTTYKPVPKNGEKVYDTTALTSKVYPNDVLASLRKLSLIEPFLGKSKNFHENENKEKTVENPSDSGLGTLASSDHVNMDKPAKRVAFQEKLNNFLSPRLSQHNSSFDKNEIAKSLSRTLLCDEMYIDDVIMAGDANPVTIATSSSSVVGSNERKSSYITPPTATLVDISTGGVVEHTEIFDDDVIIENNHQFRCAPPSFYYNRKIKRKKQEDESEREALKSQAREHIRSILNSTSSDKTIQLEPKQSTYHDITKTIFTKKSEKSNSEKSRPISVSSSMTSSSLSSNEKLPRGPNPTPSLEHHRFQIFPTSLPHTYHAYTSSSSQPTVINMEEFLRSNVNAMRIKRMKSKIAMNRKTPRTISRDKNGRRSRTMTNGCSLNISAAKLFDTDDVIPDDVRNGDAINSDVITDEVRNGDVITDEVRNGDIITDDVTTDVGETSNDDDVIRDVINHVTNPNQSEDHEKSKQSTKDNSRIEPSMTKQPLQSLSITSQRSATYDVIQKPMTSETTPLTIRRHSGVGRLSPLKGIRILRRKISVKQYDNPELEDKQSSIVLLLKGLKTHDEVYKLNTATNTDTSMSPLRIIIPAKSIGEGEEGAARSRIIPRFKLSSLPNSKIISKPLSSNVTERERQLDDVTGVSVGDFSKVPLNVEKMFENQNSGFHILKEGGAQGLNFLDSRRSSVNGEEMSPPEPKGPKRRRRAQLGRSEGSNGEVKVKITAGGGFKSNVARYSLLLRQKNNLQKIYEDQGKPQKQEKTSSDEENVISMVKLRSDEPEPTTIECSSRLLGRTRSQLKVLDFPQSETLPNYTTDSLLAETPQDDNFGERSVTSPEKTRLLSYNNSISPFNFTEHLITRSHSSFNLLPSIQQNWGDIDNEDGSGLPETGTASYRLTHDVSFDEGSRYNGGYAFADEQRVSALTGGTSATRNKANFTYLNHEHQNPSQTRLEKVDPPTRERHTPVTYKETMPLSLVRIEERLSFDSPLGRHPTSTGFSIPTTTRGQSAQGGNHPSPSTPINNGGTVTTFRLHKERQNWNYRAGDLSVNGGGYYGSTPIQPGGRAEPSGLGPLNISPASNFAHRLAASRDKQSSAAKTRLSSRYGSRNDGSPQSYGNSSNKDSHYADPCIAAPPSFQQRLTELSILESDTIKYERNRKLKRKKNQDKDS